MLRWPGGGGGGGGGCCRLIHGGKMHKVIVWIVVIMCVCVCMSLCVSLCVNVFCFVSASVMYANFRFTCHSI